MSFNRKLKFFCIDLNAAGSFWRIFSFVYIFFSLVLTHADHHAHVMINCRQNPMYVCVQNHTIIQYRPRKGALIKTRGPIIRLVSVWWVIYLLLSLLCQ